MSYWPACGSVAHRAIFALAERGEPMTAREIALKAGVCTRGLKGYLAPAIKFGLIVLQTGRVHHYRLPKARAWETPIEASALTRDVFGYAGQFADPTTLPTDAVFVARPDAPRSVWDYAQRMSA